MKSNWLGIILVTGSSIFGKNTLETSGEDSKVEKILNFTRFECIFSGAWSSVLKEQLLIKFNISPFCLVAMTGLVGLFLSTILVILSWLVGYIFSARFECIFSSSPPVSSVFFHLLHSFRVFFFSQVFQGSVHNNTMENLPHTFSLLKSNAWLLILTIVPATVNTLETSGEDARTHSKRVEKM